MPNGLGKNLNLCFKKIRFPLASQPSSSQLLTPDDSRRLLTSSATTTASSANLKNYNSLYDSTFDYSTSKSLTLSSSLSFDPEPEPDFATVFASQRFFFTSPGSSNSIIESTPPSSVATTPESSGTVSASSSINPIDNANESFNDGYEHIPPTTVEDSVAVRLSLPTIHGFQEIHAGNGAFADLLVSLMAEEDGGGGNDGKIAEVTGVKINEERCM
ncbi:Acyl-CoA N-acyltransferase with RING/FYVE/PHD-type zinc finger protein, putative isoform 1 [Hibiscus syriacus]|uniref:Acyl-CoA N-acyltransferase with RING/FYVE/PHD-type zinc finger protein, putative isoform 1 n=1 Tax=Hibiscus syriacus TaxID=106335 RepID=A0A6A2XXW8_HIBSY|nr:Acyl-CoA N-acyltransferase with RING/FYVE/PHD-type zinc finger protein, putative isoform 1 [Hibiscus syriacus]